VRIALDNSDLANALRPGLSVVVNVDVRDGDGAEHAAGSGLASVVTPTPELSERN
jgi:membrane fusion protein (multidrug efflux system)